jgi:hypothetical protein
MRFPQKKKILYATLTYAEFNVENQGMGGTYLGRVFNFYERMILPNNII